MPLFTGDTFNGPLDALTAGLSQVLFPVVLLLGLTGLLVGILQSYDHFTIPAISPAVWNVVILILLVVLRPHFHGGYEEGNQLYAYAIAILVATFVQLLMAAGGARAHRLPPADAHRLARPAHQAGVHADAAGDDRPRASSTSTS